MNGNLIYGTSIGWLFVHSFLQLVKRELNWKIVLVFVEEIKLKNLRAEIEKPLK